LEKSGFGHGGTLPLTPLLEERGTCIMHFLLIWLSLDEFVFRIPNEKTI